MFFKFYEKHFAENLCKKVVGVFVYFPRFGSAHCTGCDQVKFRFAHIFITDLKIHTIPIFFLKSAKIY